MSTAKLESWAVKHPVTAQDKAAMRAVVEPNNGRLQGTAARAPFDEIMNRIKAPPPETKGE